MKLPHLPSLEEIQANIPRIAVVPKDSYRPFWSVMIPTYNSGDYLGRTLESVLSQDPGPDKMQIEVIDGCSTEDRPEEVVKNLAGDRVSFSRIDSNRGPAYTWNACIERSRGHWVHILHGDDMVMPGFYKAYNNTIQAYSQGIMVCGQVVVVDDKDRWLKLDGIVPPSGGGIIEDFTERQAWQQSVVCPSVVVRRDAYETLGGFCTLYRSVCDWDMWFRLGQLGCVVSVPYPKAFYRVHGESETIRLMVSGSHVRESYSIVNANLIRMNKPIPEEEKKHWRSNWAAKADGIAWQLANENSAEGRYNHAYWAWALSPTIPRMSMLLKSWFIYKVTDKVCS